ncbi:hypothetical protein Tco_1353797 [Tanacetum coccineum]
MVFMTKDAAKGIKHWGGVNVEWRKLWYKSQMNKIFLSKMSYSTHNKSLGCEELLVSRNQDAISCICHLEEIMVKRADRQPYKFKKSYQKKLNITAPQQTFPEIEFKELYTPSYKPPRDEIHHRVLNFHLGYNDEMLRRKWTAIDKNRSELMAELIDKQMRERRIFKNIKRLVGAREPQNQRDLPRDIPLDRVEVLRNRVNTYAIRNTKLLSGIEDSHHGPNDAMHNPSQPLNISQKTLVSFLTETKHISIDFLTPS